MRSFDWTPYRRTTVGFDRLFDYLEQANGNGAENYPPFDIEKIADDRYRITLAVAGFKAEEIDITSHQNLLTVTGRKGEADSDTRQMIHNGIANRAFERRFQLADFVRVDAADLADGLLTLDLVREVPEAMKPRKIGIGATNNGTATIADLREAA